MSITLQPWKLKLLSIPKLYPQSIESCTHAIIKNIFFPRSRDTLFSFTQNALEFAIVADVNVIAEDFLSLKLEGMMVTDDVFCAFMVDDPDGIDNSGRRINELSALLSRNEISIFYVSTRITDLILVKEKRIKLVLPTIRSLFSLSVDSDCDISSSSRGFTTESDQGSYPGSSFTSMNSFLHTPASPSRGQSAHFQFPSSQHQNGSYTSSHYLSNNQASFPYGSSIGSSYKPSTGISIPFRRQPSYGSNFSGGPHRGFFGSMNNRIQADSDTSSNEGTNGRTGSGNGNTRSNTYQKEQRVRQDSYADSSIGEGVGRYFRKRHGPGSGSIDSLDSFSSPRPLDIKPNGTMDHPRREMKSSSISQNDDMMFPPLTPLVGSFQAFGSFSSLGIMQESVAEQEEREFKIKEQVRKSCPRYVIEDKLILAGLAPDYQDEWAVTLIKVLFYPEQLPAFSSDAKSRFISFTTTDEGTSLIADQEVLAHFEEHMLNKSSSETMLRCIQVDLSTFGLDTYGLVYSMSNPLVEHDVNLLCLSTFRTANVLVHESDLEKSLKILSMST
ncbi:GATS protein-like 3 [Haplosporangium sp. Z 27]|nr:GATS protein-like 3 [Haplosporangium sp. Z 27]